VFLYGSLYSFLVYEGGGGGGGLLEIARDLSDRVFVYREIGR
jgi:hypothetical protein